jgi:Domain of unknown function (DUF4262)
MNSRRRVNSNFDGLDSMTDHDSRCTGGSAADQRLLADVARYGWHVMLVLDTPQTPGWAYSVGLFKSFNHPEIVVFGLDVELMQIMINEIGDGAKRGKQFKVGEQYADLIDSYSCTLREVRSKWYAAFLNFGNWFYEEKDYPVLQCFWPDFKSRYPWEPEFDQQLVWAQPLLFHEDQVAANVTPLIESLDLEVGG